MADIEALSETLIIPQPFLSAVVLRLREGLKKPVLYERENSRKDTSLTLK